MERVFSYGSIKLEYHYKEVNFEKCLILLDKMKRVNSKSGKNFGYGVFELGISKNNIQKFFNRTLICIISNEGGPIGFFYNYIIQKEITLSHQGLVLIAENPKCDLLKIPYALANIVVRDELKENFYVSNISATPLIVGVFTELFDNVWPSHISSNLRISSESHKRCLSLLEENYIRPYFENFRIDQKRSILVSPNSDMGFCTNIRDLPRHDILEVNLLTQYWIDPSKGEDMLQTGEMTDSIYEKLKKIINNKVIEHN